MLATMMDISRCSSICICLALFIAISVADRTVEVAFENGSKGSYNVGEDIKLMCNATDQGGIYVSFVMSWYKKQDGGWVEIAENVEIRAPFSSKPDKYVVERIDDVAIPPKGSWSNLIIRGLEAEDTGDYMCKGGYPTNDDVTESKQVNMMINPAKESAQLALTPTAPDDQSMIPFNIGQEIKCMAQADSLSTDLNLIMKLDSNTEITQDFEFSSEVVWSGDDGLRVPTRRLQLINDEWVPEKAGQYVMSCILQDGDNQIVVQSFSLTREETASLECDSNYKRPVKEDDLDVVITCNVMNYGGDLNFVELEWSFVYDDETVTLMAPHQKYLRIAKREGETFSLHIPRISLDMVATGKAFEYEAKLRHKENGGDIAATTFPLAIDSTRAIQAASHLHLSFGFILISTVLAHTVL